MSLEKIIKKSVAAFVAISLLYSNSYLCGLGMLEVIAQDIKEPNINLNIQNTKYVQFKEEMAKEPQNNETSGTEEKEIEYYSGVAIKTNLQLGVEEQETQLPIKRAELSISLPALNGYLPERASVVAANTMLSTGEKNINKINQNYDSNSGLLNVSYQNEEAYSKYNKESKDEFEIIYIYQPEAYSGNQEEILLQYAVNSRITFEIENGEISSEKTQSFELKEKDNKGNLLEFSVTGLENDIYKGFMYSNVKYGTNNNTDYNTVSTLCVLNSNIAKDLTMEIKENNFVLKGEENTKISADGAIIYKATNISKTEFDKILGKDGVLEIYSGDTLIATVKYIDVNDNDKIIKRLAIIYSDDNIKLLSDDESIARVEYNNDVTSITIKTTKPIAEGYINFKNETTIKASNEYVADVKEIKSIETTSVINEKLITAELLLIEPKTRISINSSNVNFSTLQTNKTTLTIKLDSTNASTKLFNNPIITIKLPEGIVGGNLSSPEIVNGNGLKIKNTNAEGNKITIELEGIQKAYDLTNVSGGTTIVMDIENIDFEDTIPTHEDKIEVTCIQGNEETKTEQKISIVSKAGLLILSKLTGYDDSKNTLKSIDSEVKTVEIKNNAKQREVIQTIDLVNNYDAKINNTEIIGRIGYTNNELNSTFDISLSKPIEVNNAKVYYSTNKEAQYSDDSWSDKFVADAKAYKIEINDNGLESKDRLAVKLYYNIPANIQFNEKTYVKTEINYSYNENSLNDSCIWGMKTEENDLTVNSKNYNVMLMNEEGNENPISVIVTPKITQNYVHSGQMVTYNIKVINNGNQDLKNVVINDIIPDNAIYTYEEKKQSMAAGYIELVKDEETKNVEWKLETLKAGESKDIEIILTMKDVSQEQSVVNKVVLNYNGQNKTTESALILKPAKLETSLITNEEGMIGITYDVGGAVVYYIKVKNISGEKQKNIKVKFELPSELEYIEGGLTSFDEFEGYSIVDKVGEISNNLFEYNVDSLKADEEVTIEVSGKVRRFSDVWTKEIVAIGNVELNEEIYETNIKAVISEQSGFTLNMNSNINDGTVLKHGDEVIYTIELKNTGKTSIAPIIKLKVPEQLEVIKLEKYNNQEIIYQTGYLNNDIELNNFLEKGGTLTLKITAKVLLLKVEEVTNIDAICNATAEYADIKLQTKQIKLTIQPEKLEAGADSEGDEQGSVPSEKYEEEVKDGVNEELPPIPEIKEPDISNEGNEEELPKQDNEQDKDPEPDDDGNDEQDKEDEEEQKPEQDDKEDIEEDDNPNTDSGQEDEENKKPEQDDKENEDQGQEEGENKEPEQPGGQNQPGQPEKPSSPEQSETTVYSISGQVWIDSNKDGKKDEIEQLKEGITVTLIDMTKGDFALDNTGNKITTSTNLEGRYIFNNIINGSYAVMFEFDTNTYTVATYKKENISEELNSDAILSTVTINTEKKNVGLTDKMEVNSNKENIDLGLIENPIFDLSLDKKITKITVIDKQGTKEYEYKNGHTAKVDLVAKYMNGANVIINYQFTITNNGEVTGYVDSLLDSLPSGLEFISEMNEDWYKGTDGNLYTTAIAGKPIKPGESIQIDLVLTKTMTEDNTGTFVNSAKLEKISNLENLKEKDEALEGNESSAILIISIKTGSVFLYLGITLACIAIIIVGTYIIKNKILDREI